MCLAIIAVNASPEWPLVIVANRDELHSRPTLPARPWTDAATVLGGRDLSAGGTWLGMTTGGRLALLTNYREPGFQRPDAPSRGQLTEQYLKGNASAQDYALTLNDRGQSYNGFNLLVGDSSGLWFCSNRSDASIQRLNTGVVGISNASLNTPWPKLKRAQQAVSLYLKQAKVPDPSHLFAIFQDTKPALPHELPSTGLDAEREKLLSSPFIKDDRYGTRCTTLIMQSSDGNVLFHEKRYRALGLPDGDSVWTIDTIAKKIVEA